MFEAYLIFTQSLILCFFTFSFCSKDSQDCDRSAAIGDNITLPLSHKLDKLDKLRWMHDKDIILYLRENVKISGSKDVYENGSLKLTNLMKDESGIYKPEVNAGSEGTEIKGLKTIHLCVLDRVPAAKVKTDCRPTSKSVIFTCQVATTPQPNDLKFGWLKNNEVLPKETKQTLTRVAEKVEKDSFSCNVSNVVSYMISPPAIQSCLKRKPLFPEKLFGINTWIFVGAGGGIVLVLIIVVIVGCICAKRKKKMQMKDEGELRLAWTNEQEQRQHQHSHPPNHPHQHQHNHPPDQRHHHHHHEKQPAGHTGPRQPRSKQNRDQQRPRAPDNPKGHPQPSPRRPAQAPKPVDNVDEEQPPPLPQPRKKAAKAQRV
ncbi:T-cell surface antigen CD2-like isoform X1 [Sebastes fasciatus]|uniref:T-cell surface antigen CD2-like isoform X1 n=1 Tax=Sebastes fasciatus TaxID=394691 RepID=UPI003D9F6C2A